MAERLIYICDPLIEAPDNQGFPSEFARRVSESHVEPTQNRGFPERGLVNRVRDRVDETLQKDE